MLLSACRTFASVQDPFSGVRQNSHCNREWMCGVVRLSASVQGPFPVVRLNSRADVKGMCCVVR